VHISNLDLNLLRIFDAVYAHRNVCRAAEQLGLSQPAFSHGLTRLRASCDSTPKRRASCNCSTCSATCGCDDSALPGYPGDRHPDRPGRHPAAPHARSALSRAGRFASSSWIWARPGSPLHCTGRAGSAMILPATGCAS
jgi:hypothetical protein